MTQELATPTKQEIQVRRTTEDDFEGIQRVCLEVYPDMRPWTHAQLTSHLAVFPEGQFTAVTPDGEVAGMASSLVLTWDDYDVDQNWRDFTAGGFFTNHDPGGRTLYGAEVMVRPAWQGHGVGSALYAARRKLCRELGLMRIRAGARLRGYHRHASTLSAEDYARAVVRGELHDPTLSFQLHRGFRVIAVVSGYLPGDPESLGWAAIIEWLNPEVVRPGGAAGANRFAA